MKEQEIRTPSPFTESPPLKWVTKQQQQQQTEISVGSLYHGEQESIKEYTEACSQLATLSSETLQHR